MWDCMQDVPNFLVLRFQCEMQHSGTSTGSKYLLLPRNKTELRKIGIGTQTLEATWKCTKKQQLFLIANQSWANTNLSSSFFQTGFQNEATIENINQWIHLSTLKVLGSRPPIYIQSYWVVRSTAKMLWSTSNLEGNYMINNLIGSIS